MGEIKIDIIISIRAKFVQSKYNKWLVKILYMYG